MNKKQLKFQAKIRAKTTQKSRSQLENARISNKKSQREGNGKAKQQQQKFLNNSSKKIKATAASYECNALCDAVMEETQKCSQLLVSEKTNMLFYLIEINRILKV